jgi:hypothetical protein
MTIFIYSCVIIVQGQKLCGSKKNGLFIGVKQKLIGG